MKSKILFFTLIGIYLLSIITTTLLDFNTDNTVIKEKNKLSKAKDLQRYMHLDHNLSALKLHKIWDIPEYEEPKNSENNSSQEKNSFELRDSNGFYTIIIGQKELDFLGVIKSDNERFTVLFDHNQTKNKKITHYKVGDRIYKSIKLHKIENNFILLVDTQTHQKIEVPYFFVNEDEFKPKDNNAS